MTRPDKAVLRLATGMGLAALIAYGFALTLPFVACMLTVLLLCKPGPPLPLAKGVVLALVTGALLVLGVLMVPLLENYAVGGVLLTGALLYAVFLAGALRANPLTIFLVIALTFIPVAGVAEQALAKTLSVTVGVGIGVGVLVSAFSHALFPDPPAQPAVAGAPASASAAVARAAAGRATAVVLPIFVLALTNPAFYLAAIMKSVMLGQQAGSARAASAGRELVGSTLMGAGLAIVVWLGLSLRPNLWMLMLWLTAAALWAGTKLYGVSRTAFAPTFWSNALLTMLILLGPAIEDAAVGKDVYRASAIRVSLFIGIALYAWAVVWLLERRRAPRSLTPGLS